MRCLGGPSLVLAMAGPRPGPGRRPGRHDRAPVL